MAYIEFEDVKKIYGTGEAQVRALDGVSFQVEKGEFVVLLGSSGAGKTGAEGGHRRADRRGKDHPFEYAWGHGYHYRGQDSL